MGTAIISVEEERSAGEAALHRFFVLVIADVVHKKAAARVGATLLHKILFNVRRELQRLAAPDLSMVFVKHHYGPYSPTVAADEKYLRESGLLTASGVTPRGGQVLEAFLKPVMAALPRVMKTVLTEASTRATWSAERAKREVYALRVRLGERVVAMKDVPMGTPFFARPEPVTVSPHLLLELAVAISHSSRREAGNRFSSSREAEALLS